MSLHTIYSPTTFVLITLGYILKTLPVYLLDCRVILLLS